MGSVRQGRRSHQGRSGDANPDHRLLGSEGGRGECRFLLERASGLLSSIGLTGKDDWCKVDATTFESAVPRVHVLGDAIFAGAMPKSAFAATSQAKVCAMAIAALQAGQAPATPSFINTCYSLLAPDYGITVADVFRVAKNGTIAAVEGAEA